MMRQGRQVKLNLGLVGRNVRIRKPVKPLPEAKAFKPVRNLKNPIFFSRKMPQNPRIPSRQAIIAELNKGPYEAVRGHTTLVKTLALEMGKALERKGTPLDLRFLENLALAHDVAKGREKDIYREHLKILEQIARERGITKGFLGDEGGSTVAERDKVRAEAQINAQEVLFRALGFAGFAREVGRIGYFMQNASERQLAIVRTETLLVALADNLCRGGMRKRKWRHTPKDYTGALRKVVRRFAIADNIPEVRREFKEFDNMARIWNAILARKVDMVEVYQRFLRNPEARKIVVGR